MFHEFGAECMVYYHLEGLVHSVRAIHCHSEAHIVPGLLLELRPTAHYLWVEQNPWVADGRQVEAVVVAQHLGHLA